MESVRRASQGLMAHATTAPATQTGDSVDADLSNDAFLLEDGRRDADYVEGQENEPLLLAATPERAMSEQNPNQRQFRAEQNEAIQQVVWQGGWFSLLVFLAAFLIFGFWFYVNIRSWYVLIKYWGSPCDQPLNEWLLVKLVLDIISSSAQQRQRSLDDPPRLTWVILFLVNVWLVFGFHWISESHTCQSSSPELYDWVNFLVVFGTVVTLILMLLPVLFYMLVIIVVHLVGTGRIRNQRAAREDTIDLLDQVMYNRKIFADPSAPDDTRPSGECCCCCENFNAEKDIVRTPCKHFFHRECLAEWFKLAKTCPVCRLDLDAATESLSTKNKAASSSDEYADTSADLDPMLGGASMPIVAAHTGHV